MYHETQKQTNKQNKTTTTVSITCTTCRVCSVIVRVRRFLPLLGVEVYLRTKYNVKQIAIGKGKLKF